MSATHAGAGLASPDLANLSRLIDEVHESAAELEIQPGSILVMKLEGGRAYLEYDGVVGGFVLASVGQP